MLEERRADDIRIGHLDHFLDVQFGKAMEHFLPMYLDFARFSAITDGKNALLSLLSNFAAYLVIGARLCTAFSHWGCSSVCRFRDTRHE